MKAEIRGHDGEWRVFYPEEGGLATPVAVYDRDGKLARTVNAGGPTGKMVEAHHVSPTRDEAESYARYLGADEVKFVVTERRAPRKPRDEVPVWQQR
jgi:hypothetical protein